MIDKATIKDVYEQLGINSLNQPSQHDDATQVQQIMRYDEFLKNFGIFKPDSFILDYKTSLN